MEIDNVGLKYHLPRDNSPTTIDTTTRKAIESPIQPSITKEIVIKKR